MRQALLLAVFVLNAAIAGACQSPTTRPAMTDFDFDAYQWKNRPLLVFAPGEDDERLKQQVQLLDEARAGLAERDMVVIRVIGQETAFAGDTKLGAEAARRLRERFDVPAGRFAVLLVGKDGGVKRTEADVTPMKPVFDQVDAMPMRRSEMCRQDEGQKKP